MKDIPLIFIVGPTAVGKSEIGLRTAEHLKGEIVCCDAMQVYREISIASDKPPQKILKELPHHVVDVVSVSEDFNVARFRQLAMMAIEDIRARGKTPLVVGGSGMYMSVLLDGIFEKDAGNEALRQELAQQASSQGLAALHERLEALDPQAAGKIHPHDPHRIIRALEVVLSTGEPMSLLQQKRLGVWNQMPVKAFALMRPREELYQRIEARVEEMFARGLVEEIRKVSQKPLSRTARMIIGIPEVTGYLKGEYDLTRAKYLMKLNSRHYAKRQLTWFRRDKRLKWINITSGQSAQQIADIITGQIE